MAQILSSGSYGYWQSKEDETLDQFIILGIAARDLKEAREWVINDMVNESPTGRDEKLIKEREEYCKIQLEKFNNLRNELPDDEITMP